MDRVHINCPTLPLLVSVRGSAALDGAPDCPGLHELASAFQLPPKKTTPEIFAEIVEEFDVPPSRLADTYSGMTVKKRLDTLVRLAEHSSMASFGVLGSLLYDVEDLGAIFDALATVAEAHSQRLVDVVRALKDLSLVANEPLWMLYQALLTMVKRGHLMDMLCRLEDVDVREVKTGRFRDPTYAQMAQRIAQLERDPKAVRPWPQVSRDISDRALQLGIPIVRIDRTEERRIRGLQQVTRRSAKKKTVHLDGDRVLKGPYLSREPALLTNLRIIWECKQAWKPGDVEVLLDAMLHTRDDSIWLVIPNVGKRDGTSSKTLSQKEAAVRASDCEAKLSVEQRCAIVRHMLLRKSMGGGDLGSHNVLVSQCGGPRLVGIDFDDEGPSDAPKGVQDLFGGKMSVSQQRLYADITLDAGTGSRS